MTYSADCYRQAEVTARPKMFWARVHKWAGYAIFGLACFSAGTVNSTIYYRITHLWHVAGSESGGKSEAPTTVPDCVSVHPLPKPSP